MEFVKVLKEVCKVNKQLLKGFSQLAREPLLAHMRSAIRLSETAGLSQTTSSSASLALSHCGHNNDHRNIEAAHTCEQAM